MASKSVYQDYDTGALTHYDLAGDPMYGVISGSNVEKVLVTSDKTTYDHILDTLESVTETDSTFVNKKKAFILPGASVSLDKLKAALKEHKITVTNDYTQADLIITHENLDKRCENGENIPSTKMLVRMWNYEATTGVTNGSSGIDSLIRSSNYDVIVTPKITNNVRYYTLDISESLYDNWLITGLAVNIAHLIDTGAVGTIDCETVLHASASKVILDEDLLDQIKNMLNSSSEDRELAGSIIPNIDYTKNPHLLWKFSQDCNNITYNFNRNKDVQYWLEKSNFDMYYRNSAEQMILQLEEEGKLTKESFKYLEPIVRKEISIHNRDLYVFKVSVKKEYLKYLK